MFGNKQVETDWERTCSTGRAQTRYCERRRRVRPNVQLPIRPWKFPGQRINSIQTRQAAIEPQPKLDAG
jgi:hypothetical protein